MKNRRFLANAKQASFFHGGEGGFSYFVGEVDLNAVIFKKRLVERIARIEFLLQIGAKANRNVSAFDTEGNGIREAYPAKHEHLFRRRKMESSLDLRRRILALESKHTRTGLGAASAHFFAKRKHLAKILFELGTGDKSSLAALAVCNAHAAKGFQSMACRHAADTHAFGNFLFGGNGLADFECAGANLFQQALLDLVVQRDDAFSIESELAHGCSSCIDDWTYIAEGEWCQADFTDEANSFHFSGDRRHQSQLEPVLQSRRKRAMSEALPIGEAVLEVISNDGAKRYVRVTQTPFFIGRGAETGNHLQLNDRRISRNCAAIVSEANKFYIEDRGQRRGLYVNGEKVESRELQHGDAITFGLEDSYEIIYRSSETSGDDSIPMFLTRIEHMTSTDQSSGGLNKLNLLLEATTLLHSQLPLDSVLGKMLDHAISVTNADRGLLLETNQAGQLGVRLARRNGGMRLPPESLSPSQTAIQMALKQQAAVITEDLAQAEMNLQEAQSIVSQGLRSVVVIPLYSVTRASSDESLVDVVRGQFLGVVYLDSRKPAAFSRLDRQILDALAADAAGTLDNARLVERERERQRLEQEINIARDIQQALLPRALRKYPYLDVKGCNFPCLSVGGDYFDVFPMGDGRTAFLIADVSGKGLGAALLTTMLQGALSGLTLGYDPARVFTHINRFLCDHAEVGRYATMFFGVMDGGGHMEFINAGHPSPYLIRNGKAETPFTEGSYPVGLVPEAEYTAACLKLEPGDTLVLFSDGVTEAMDPDDEMFGMPRLAEVLNDKNDVPLDHLQKCVLEAVENFVRGARQADDLTMLLVRYQAASKDVMTDTDAPSTSSAVA